MSPSRNSVLFLVLGALLGAALMAGYSYRRWHAEEVRLSTSRIDSGLELLQRIERRDSSARDQLRSELRTQINALAARDDLSFYQCTSRRRILERADRNPNLARGDAVDARKTAEILGRFQAGAFACERK